MVASCPMYYASWPANALCLLLLLGGCNPPGLRPDAELQYTLATLPFTEYWSGFEFDHDRVGYGRFTITPTATGDYLIETETRMQFRMLGTDKHFHYLTRDRVDQNLTLLSFTHEYQMDNSLLHVQGYVAGDALHATITSASGIHQQTLALDAPLYPYTAQLLYPLLAGLKLDAHYQYQVYEAEAQRIHQVNQQVTAHEYTRNIPTWRIATDINHDQTTSWLSNEGLPVQEQAANGNIQGYLLEPERASTFLEHASTRETLLDFSLVRTSQRLHRPRELQRMVVELTGLGDFTMPTEGSQQCQRQNSDSYTCTISTRDQSHTAPSPQALASNPTIPTGHTRLQQLTTQLTDNITQPKEQINALVDWIHTHIRGEAIDAFSAMDVLDQGRGECQGQTFLYTAMARTLGIPTRVVNGLVYAPEYGGFLYHTWAESWDGSAWHSVDPILGQIPADATHIKLIYGENLADFAPLTTLMGQLSASILAIEPG